MTLDDPVAALWSTLLFVLIIDAIILAATASVPDDGLARDQPRVAWWETGRFNLHADMAGAAPEALRAAIMQTLCLGLGVTIYTDRI